jgi:hypothetical protein
MDERLAIPLEYDFQRASSMAEKQMKKSKEIDLRVFMELDCGIWSAKSDFVNAVANELRQLKKFNLVQSGSGDLNSYIITNKTWSEKYPIGDKIRTGLITALFSIGVGVLVFQLNNRAEVQNNNLRDQRLTRLTDSLRNLANALKDSIASLRSDSTILNK